MGLDKRESALVLNAIFPSGSRRLSSLIREGVSVSRLLAASVPDLIQEFGFSPAAAHRISVFPADQFLTKELKAALREKITIIEYGSPRYPYLLSQVDDAPLVLYVKGSLADGGVTLAVVGSRRASLYGLTMAEKFSRELSAAGFSIVSGMARGIDAAAHRGALNAGGSTFAVVGCGLLHVYPLENKDLMERIAGQGAVISEFPLETLPVAYHFPRRNRIISGLSWGVLVVEASPKSGALITSRCALEQGREVFALPGKVDSPLSAGGNQLIKDGAKIVTCLEDVLEELPSEMRRQLIQSKDPKSSLSSLAAAGILTDEELQVLQHFEAERTVHLDALTAAWRDNHNSLASVLLQLELKRRIRAVPGKFFVKL